MSEELDAGFDELLTDVTDGALEMEFDGKRRKDQDPEARLNVLERLERRAAGDAAGAQPHFGLRMVTLVPPGCG